MRVRLGFSIAISLEPDIVLMDEVLAVGDRRFKAKCYNEIDKLIKNTSIVFVSHRMPSVVRICTHIMVHDNGRVVYYGDNVNEGIDYYSLFPTDESSITGVGQAYINNFTLFSEKGFYSNEGIYNIKYLDTIKY